MMLKTCVVCTPSESSLPIYDSEKSTNEESQAEDKIASMWENVTTVLRHGCHCQFSRKSRVHIKTNELLTNVEPTIGENPYPIPLTSINLNATFTHDGDT
jgi:hypothetical protein